MGVLFYPATFNRVAFCVAGDLMTVSVLIVEKITEQEREAIAEVYGRSVIESALINARALRVLQEGLRRQAIQPIPEQQVLTPLTYAEMRRDEQYNRTEKIMRSRSSGRLGSET